MATPNPLILPLATVILLLLSLFLPLANSVSDQELDAAISALRSQGYNLFGNAITASDVRFDLLRPNSSYTLFAPSDSTIFALDMASSAAAFVLGLRRHVALRRLPLPVLRALPPGSHLPTLDPRRNIAISLRYQSTNDYFVAADGVDVVLPGIFYGQDVAVHGLAGILPLHRDEASGRPVRPPRLSDPYLPPYLSGDPPDQWSPAPSPTAGLSPMVQETQTLAPTPGPHSPPYLSAEPPMDWWLPLAYPTADLSPTVPEMQAPAPTPGSRSTFAAAAVVPPSYVDGIQPPMEPGIVPDAPPSRISPAIGALIAEVVSPGVNPPTMNFPAASPLEIVSPGGNALEGIPVTSPVGSPMPTVFSWNGRVLPSSRIAACGEAVGGEEGRGLVAVHRGHPRPRSHASDDAL